jgi:hypothetical protein
VRVLDATEPGEGVTTPDIKLLVDPPGVPLTCNEIGELKLPIGVMPTVYVAVCPCATVTVNGVAVK